MAKNNFYSPIRVVIADDHEIFREGFKAMASKQEVIKVVGEAANGLQLIETVTELTPDVVITDIKMPQMDGIKATRILHEKFPLTQTIALSMFDDENLIIDMLEAGAKGYLLKNAHKNDIVDAIQTVNGNQTYFCSHTSKKLAKLIAGSHFNPYKHISRPEFSEKELEVMKLICEQFSNREMAARINLSSRTVEGYREKLLEKTHSRNTVGIVIYAIKNGIYEI